MNKGTITQPLAPDGSRPVVALVAHDGRKEEMAQWAAYNEGTLSRCTLWATQTTGRTLQTALKLKIHLLLSGPLGGDAQLGTLIAEGRVDVVVFFWDPLTSQPHDVDVKALLRLAVLHDVPIACNRSTADYLISSPLFAVPANYREARGQQAPSAPDGTSS
jgi:methylglyoxal synthase